MAEIRLQAPDSFNFKTPDEWPKWRKRYEQFRIASGLSGDAAAKQVNTLLYCMGDESDAILDSMKVTEDERGDYTVVLRKFDDFFKVRRNVIFERARFNLRSQQEGESAEEFIMELYRLVENCDYGEFQDEMIRDRLVVGIRNQQLSERMQLDPDLNLEKAKKMSRQLEAVCDQSRELKRESTTVDTVLSKKTVSKQGKPPYKRKDYAKDKRAPEKKRCTRCGGGHQSQDKCPAKEATCYNCQKKGHYGKQCFNRKNLMWQIYRKKIWMGSFLT